MTAQQKRPAVDFSVETVALADLKPHPRNYREHPDDQLQHLVESIREHGLYRNVITARDGTILAGHGVVQAARSIGIEHVPVRRLDLDPDDPRALKLLVGDNEISHLGEVDDRALSEMLKEISERDREGLLGTGYDEMMLANLVIVTRPKSEIQDFDEAAHWAGMPEYDEGIDRVRLIISFETDDERRALMETIGAEKPISTHGKDWSLNWPLRERFDAASAKFMG